MTPKAAMKNMNNISMVKVLVTNIICCVSFVAYCGVNQCQCDHFIAYYLSSGDTVVLYQTIDVKRIHKHWQYKHKKTQQKETLHCILYTKHKLNHFYSDDTILLRVGRLTADILGAVSIRKTVLPGVAIPMLKIRRPNGRLIFNIGIAIPR